MVESSPVASPTPLGEITVAALDLLPTGLGIFDRDLRLVYCNASFRRLRELPASLCRPGTHLAEVIRHNAMRGDYGPGDADEQVAARMAEIAAWRPREVERELSDGRRLLIQYTPVGPAGLMVTYTDVTEGRRLERVLRESEERYALVSRAVAEGIYDWNIERNDLFVSAKLMEILGFDGEELASEDWNARVHPEDTAGYRRALRDCFKGRTAGLICEYRIRARSGAYSWVEDHGLPVRNASGRAVRLVGAISDITQRKETERALRESEQRHALAMQAVNEGVYDWNIVTGDIYYSPRVLDAVGSTPEQLRTRNDWVDRIHPDDLPAYRTALKAHLKGETERFECEYRYRYPDGTWHWARQHGLALRDETGRAYRMAGSTGDITLEKATAEALDRARRQLHDAVETIAEGFALFDPADRIVLCNSRYRAFFPEIADLVRPGTSFETLIRAAVARGMFPAAAAEPEAWIAGLLARRRLTGIREQHLSSGIWLQVGDYRTSDGSLVSVYTDVTELKRRQTELQRARDDAESALQRLQAAQRQLVVQEKMASLGQLAAGVAHEIKNPLNFINNFSELSRELLNELLAILTPSLAGLDAGMRAEADGLIRSLHTNLGKIADHGGRADRIVKNMLRHSRHGEAQRSVADVDALIEESLNLAYHGARAERQGFDIRIDKRLDAGAGQIEGYPQDLQRAFLNLFSNGFYAAHKRKCDSAGTTFEPILEVSARSTENGVEVRVRDNGMGIPPEARDRVFTPFFTTKPPGEGTGLGLSLTYDIVVKQHGGTLTFDSVPGSFTEFVVTLPRRAPEAVQR